MISDVADQLKPSVQKHEMRLFTLEVADDIGLRVALCEKYCANKVGIHQQIG